MPSTHSRARECSRAHHALLYGALTLAFLAGAAGGKAAAQGVVVYDFASGSLPSGVTLRRGSVAVGAGGSITPAQTPRFVSELVVSGARAVSTFDSTRRVMAYRAIGDLRYTLVWDNRVPALTTDTPGVDPSPSYVYPDSAIRSRFGWDGSVYGNPTAGELLPDGTVLLHTRGAAPDLRSQTLRTTIDRFSMPDAFEVVRVSDYAPPPGSDPSYILYYFTRTTYLPHLGRWVSAISEYRAGGLVSSGDPAVGRALGYASTDSGRTWRRVIDTDAADLGRGLVPRPKHLHHLEPFEWFDPSDETWKIGAVALVGDGPFGCAPVIVRSDGPEFPDPAQGSVPTFHLPKGAGETCLTDVFPLGGSQSPGNPPTFLAGTDGLTSHQSGMWSLSFEPSGEVDVPHFQPTVGFVISSTGTLEHNTLPFVFQLGRLANGTLVAPGWWGGNGAMFVSPGLGSQWTLAYLPSHTGFRGVLPVGDGGLFWTRSDIGSGVTQLFDVPVPASRDAILLGARARDVRGVPIFSAARVTVTEQVTDQAPPEGLPSMTVVQRIESTALRAGDVISTGLPQAVSARPGQFLQLVYWLKPARGDLGVARFSARIDLTLADGRTFTEVDAPNDVGMNGWTRFVVPVAVPDVAATAATPVITMKEPASPERPLDFYVTKPQLVLSSQPTVQAYRPGTFTAPDLLSVAAGNLRASWSVAIWGTEAMSWFVSLVSPSGEWAAVQPTPMTTEAAFRGRTSLRLSASGAGSLGVSEPRNVYFPTQDLVVLTRSQPDDRLTGYVSRGLGEIDVITGAPGSGFDLAEVRFGTPSWDRVFEGTVHRVEIWDGVALELAAVEAERTDTEWEPPSPPPSCGISFELAVLLLGLRALRVGRPRSARSV
jgi:hypothetical protein